MSADALISRLDRVRSSGNGNWIARCPAHDDKRPSLTIKEADDGRVLVHCFADCSVESILSAVGLEFDALFPEKAPVNHIAKPARLQFNPRDVLDALIPEITICALFTSDVLNGVAPSDKDCRRFLDAAERIEEARRMVNG